MPPSNASQTICRGESNPGRGQSALQRQGSFPVAGTQVKLTGSHFFWGPQVCIQDGRQATQMRLSGWQVGSADGHCESFVQGMKMLAPAGSWFASQLAKMKLKRTSARATIRQVPR